MRIINVGFIGLFILMLILPFIFVDLSYDRVSVQENRMLANPPKLADIKNHPGSFVRQFDFWFKDSTGFREQLLAVNNVIDKNKWLNGIVYRDGQAVFLFGEQGHHYYAGQNGNLIPKFQGKQFLSDELLQNMTAKIEEVKAYLDSRNIPLIVMFCTDKETIYPEFYPKLFTRGPEPAQLDVITGYLQEHTGADIFNIRQALLAEKENYLLYDRSSGDLTHYNEVGAFFAYRELMKHINIHFPMMVPYGLDDIEISYNKAGIANVSLKTESKYHKLDPSFFDDVTLDQPFTWENVAYENIESDLPVILLMRDSYAGYYYSTNDIKEVLSKYIPRHFGKAIFIHYKNIRNLEEYINRYKPDIVVFESSELSLGGFADCVAGIPELPLIIATR